MTIESRTFFKSTAPHPSVSLTHTDMMSRGARVQIAARISPDTFLSTLNNGTQVKLITSTVEVWPAKVVNWVGQL